MKKRPNAYLMELQPEYRRMAEEIARLRSQEMIGRASDVKLAEAIRYAIAFTHKHLTEIINPEDLRDD